MSDKHDAERGRLASQVERMLDAGKNVVHTTAVISGEASIGDGTWIGPGVVISGPVAIGEGCRIFPGVVIGYEGESRRGPKRNGHSRIIIGDRVVLRENVVVQRGLSGDVHREEERLWGTVIEDDVMVMHGCHVAHDCWVMRWATLSPRVVLGGHTYVGVHANLGIGAMTHQKTTIGAYAMIGMGSVVVRDVPVGVKVVGNPARMIGMNEVGLERSGVTSEELLAEDERFERLSERGMVRSKEG